MSEAKHTPGPWLVEGRTVYALIHSGWKKGVQQFKNRFYASVQLDHEAPDVEAEANARLIAAAPELFYALRQIISDFPARRDWLDPDLERIARAAIAKAEGRSE